MRKKIYDNRIEGLTVEARGAADASWLDFLKERVWGDRGARFRVAGLDQKFSGRKDCVFFSLKKDGGLIGTYCFRKRKVKVAGKTRRALYRAGLAVQGAHGGNGYGKILVQAAKRYFETRSGASLSYGFIDRRNVRSIETLRTAGYERVGSFEPVVFSRFRPRDHAAIRPMTGGERKAWIRKLHRIYRDHAGVHFEDAADNWFAFRRDGRTTAGVRAREVTIFLQGLGGPLRDFVLRCLPRRSVRLATFEAVAWDAGREADLAALLEGLLSRFGVRCGILFLDPRSELYLRLKRSKKLGWVDRIYPVDPIDVMASGKKAEVRRLAGRPFYISAADVI